MNITSKENGKYLVLSVEGRIDTSNYEQFATQLQAFVDQGKKFLVLNLKELDYISSSGLRVFLSNLKTLRAIEGDVVLCCMNDKIKGVFEVSGFLSLFRVEDCADNID
jgi:anti-sigma B factor antagonist